MPERDRHVTRTGADYADAMSRLLPQGLAWPRHASSVLMQVVRGLTNIWGTFEFRASKLLEQESDPRTTVELLEDWERNWGLPDPCYEAPQTVGERQQALVLRMTLIGGVSRQFFIDLASSIGYTITITEYRPFFVAMDRCGDSRTYGVNASPNFLDSYTKVLAQFEGPDNATSFVDATGKPFTAFGNAHCDWGDKNYGASSLNSDGTTDGFSTPDHADFTIGTSDFAADGWFKCTAAAGTDRYIFSQNAGGGNAGISIQAWRESAASKISVRVCVGATAFTITGTTSFTSAVNTGWHHFAVTRSGTTMRLFIDGVQEGSATATGSINNVAAAFVIGADTAAGASSWLGWIDELRLSVGTPRWTANFDSTPTLPPMRDEFGKLVQAPSGDHNVAPGELSRWPSYGLGPLANRYYWTVHVGSTKLIWFRCASGQCGVDPHLIIGLADDLECLLNKWKPAHTQIIFDYAGLTGTGDPMAGTP